MAHYSSDERKAYYAKNKHIILANAKARRIKKLALEMVQKEHPLKFEEFKANPDLKFRVVEAPKPPKYEALFNAFKNLNGSGRHIEVEIPEGVSKSNFKNRLNTAFYSAKLQAIFDVQGNKLSIKKRD